MISFQEPAVVAVAQKVTYGASGGAIILGFSANEAAAIGGLIIAVLALVINTGMTWYFKSEHLKLVQAHVEEHMARRKSNSDKFPIGDEDEQF